MPAGTVCGAAAGNIDVLPTFIGLAGGVVPADRKTDGRDIAPLLLGTARQSPHDAYFYFRGATLDAVRAGKWKPFLATGALYALEADVGESTDVAPANPDVVQRPRGYAAGMAADLGAEATRPGPAVYPPGRVAAPQTLRLP